MNDTDNTSALENGLLGTALLAQTGQPRGAVPADHELRAWATGGLTADRQAEIESHLATNADTLQRALALAAAAGGMAPGADTNRFAWLTRLLNGPRMAAVAAGVAALAAIGLITMQGSERPGQPAPASGTLRGAVVSHPDWRIAALRGGYRLGDGVTARTTQLDALRIPQCLDGDGCPALAARLMTFGAVLAQIRSACAGQHDFQSDWPARLIPVAGAAAGSIELAAWVQPVDQLAAALDGDRRGVCAAADELWNRFGDGA